MNASPHSTDDFDWVIVGGRATRRAFGSAINWRGESRSATNSHRRSSISSLTRMEPLLLQYRDGVSSVTGRPSPRSRTVLIASIRPRKPRQKAYRALRTALQSPLSFFVQCPLQPRNFSLQTRRTPRSRCGDRHLSVVRERNTPASESANALYPACASRNGCFTTSEVANLGR